MISKRDNGNLITRRSLFPTTSFLDSFFDGALPSLNWGNQVMGEQLPAANIVEREKDYLVELSVPGYEKKDMHIEVDSSNILHVTGELQSESKEEEENYTRREFSYGSFNRSFQLPETIEAEKISAKCKNGVLKLELPKKETAILKKRVKEVQIA